LLHTVLAPIVTNIAPLFSHTVLVLAEAVDAGVPGPGHGIPICANTGATRAIDTISAR
jgi:hypothetical protein